MENYLKSFSIQGLPEIQELEKVLDKLQQKLQHRVRIEIPNHAYYKELAFPIYTIILGSQDPLAPTLGIFAGVHGLERIGSQVLISYLNTLSELLTWDESTIQLIEECRLVFIPIINPGGMYLKSRANPNGVDLMRNAPIHGEKISPFALYSGQRYSKLLPWYRGAKGSAMEIESQTLCSVVEKHVLTSKLAITLDIHSGFGMVDRVWFPYAKTQKPFPNFLEVFCLKELLDKTYPNHVYVIEPQSKQYTTHGDLWDYLYEEHRKKEGHGLFLPLTLELGSWLWAKKNIKQIFSLLGVFNPLMPHRLQRTLRRHLIFFEFLERAIRHQEAWLGLIKEKKEVQKRRALELWYSPK